MKHSAPIILLLAAILGGCTDRRPAAVPRRQAYPRIETYPAEYHSVSLSGIDLRINNSAAYSAGENGWFNISYPAYDVTVNATLSPYSPEVVINRLERIDRNLGGAAAQVARLSRGIVVVAPGVLRTPVQFLATDSARWVISGVAVSNFPPQTDPDSVAPIVDALAADMTILVNNL
ncbi:MAG: hypothetical protein NC301_07835 [Bacteroides sp.]|nr:hypothetical protein [Bacteroides sp.]MCM1380081.1 hypothetical protein [Bacteroides sp.]MCM1446418.1 hypothetical protein [Prevotella sp.]